MLGALPTAPADRVSEGLRILEPSSSPSHSQSLVSLRLVTSPDPAILLRAVADAFLAKRPATAAEPFPTPPYLLALRQGTLRDDLLALAAASNIEGWFDPPLCIFHELPRKLGVRERVTLGGYERAVLLARLLRETGSEVFARLPRPDVFVDAVDGLFGELISNGVQPHTFRSALEQRADRDDFERRRDADLARAYEAYLTLLARLDKGDGRDEWQYCAAEIAAGRADLSHALNGRREIRIFGLADLRRGWRALLHALAASAGIDSVVIYSTTATLDIGVAPELLDSELTNFAAAAARLFTDPAENDRFVAQQPVIVSAPDVEREHAEVARRVRGLIEDGVEPERIAVVSRKARPHVDYAVAALARVGVPAMARQRFTLNTIPAVRAIRTLFKAAADGWTRAGLVEIARQPYIDCAIDPRVVNYIGFRRRVAGLADWEVELRRLERETAERERRTAEGEPESDDRGHPPPPSATVRSTREALGALARFARALDAARPMSEWLDWLHQMLAGDTFGIRASAYKLAAERFDVVRRDLVALDGVAAIVREWRDALAVPGLGGRDNEQVSLARFHEELTAFLSGDAALWTPASRGVQVLEGSAAAYRSFDHVFLLGLQAGAFPAAAPQSSILDADERASLAAAGLPIDTPEVWDAREQELFRVLAAGARRSLTLSFSRIDEMGRDVVASSFLEGLEDAVECSRAEIATSEVVIAGAPLYTSASSLDQAVHGATIERIRAGDRLTVYDGKIESPDLLEWLASEFGDDRRWSPTQLEELAKCPWAYYAKRLLRLEHLEDPDEDMDHATRGSVLHLALQHFYIGAKARVGGPVFLLPPDCSWAGEMLSQALDKALAESEWKWLGHPVLRPAHRAELWRILDGYLEWEMKLHSDMIDPPRGARNAPRMIRTGADEHELRFEDMVFERDGIRIRYRGSIDRVDVSVDDRVAKGRFIAAIDYKTSVYSTPGGGKAEAWTEGVVLQVPLYAHALRTLRPAQDIARVEYQALKQPKQVHSLQLYTIDRKTARLERDEEANEKWQGALDQAVAHVRRARGGEFSANPPESCRCPPWCHGRDICRIPGGPRELRD
jgi:hypothetical protein